jgi:hypothetical protein
MTREEIERSFGYQMADKSFEYWKENQGGQQEAFEAGAEWAQMFIINKARRWLKENAHFYVSDFTGTLDENKLIEDFKKAMEE